MPGQSADDAALGAVRGGDEAAFGALAERHRRELQVHCYRMLGSFDESEDLVQDTFLRAWRSRETFAGRASFRAWLYRIATNACLDRLRHDARRPPAFDPDAGPPPAEMAWLQPYPDCLLEELVADEPGPDEAIVERETIELAFIVAIQYLPPRQRAVLILRDVLGWSARESAELLEVSVPSANSALQRAREGVRQRLPERRMDWARGPEPTADQRALIQRYVDASEQADAGELVALMHEDARFSMPPAPGVWTGRETIVASWVQGGFGTEEFGDMRCLVTSANRQPAVACYIRKPGDDRHRAMAVDVLRIVDGAITEIVTFDDDRFPAFGLPTTL